MKIVILTSVRHGSAGLVLRELVKSPLLDVVGVIYSTETAPPSRWRIAKRRLRKIARIGIGGVAVGLVLRRWFPLPGAVDIVAVAARCDVPLREVPWMNSTETADILRDLHTDLAVSLGNGYLAERVFAAPTFGTINYHGELLPEYPGALSVVWPIHEGRTISGSSIHRVSRKIDGGAVLVRNEFPILFQPRLRDTILATQVAINAHIASSIRYACENFDALAANASETPMTRSFTTPTLAQFVRMVRNNRRLFVRSQKTSAPTVDASNA